MKSKNKATEDSMVIVVNTNHPLAQSKKQITISELEEETWILRESGSGTREAAETLFQRCDIFPEQVMNFGSTQAIKETIGAGLGISLLSERAIQRELRNGDLQVIEMKEDAFHQEIFYCDAFSVRNEGIASFP